MKRVGRGESEEGGGRREEGGGREGRYSERRGEGKINVHMHRRGGRGLRGGRRG